MALAGTVHPDIGRVLQVLTDRLLQRARPVPVEHQNTRVAVAEGLVEEGLDLADRLVRPEAADVHPERRRLEGPRRRVAGPGERGPPAVRGRETAGRPLV